MFVLFCKPLGVLDLSFGGYYMGKYLWREVCGHRRKKSLCGFLFFGEFSIQSDLVFSGSFTVHHQGRQRQGKAGMLVGCGVGS